MDGLSGSVDVKEAYCNDMYQHGCMTVLCHAVISNMPRLEHTEYSTDALARGSRTYIPRH